METISNFFLLNLLWLTASLPLVTLFPATAAMFGVVRDWTAKKENGIFRPFLSHFKENFKQSFLFGMLFFVFAVVFVIDFFIIDELEAVMSVLVMSLLFVLGLIAAFVLVYLFPVMVHYRLSMKGIVKNAFFYSVMFFPTTIVSLLLVSAMILLVFFIPVSFIFVFSITAYLVFLMCHRSFKKVAELKQE